MSARVRIINRSRARFSLQACEFCRPGFCDVKAYLLSRCFPRDAGLVDRVVVRRGSECKFSISKG